MSDIRQNANRSRHRNIMATITAIIGVTRSDIAILRADLRGDFGFGINMQLEF